MKIAGLAGLVLGFLVVSSMPLGAQTFGDVAGVLNVQGLPLQSARPFVPVQQFRVDPTAMPVPASDAPPNREWFHTTTRPFAHLGGVQRDGIVHLLPLLPAPSLSNLLSEPTPRTFDLDQALAAVLDTHNLAFMQRTRQRPQRTQASSGDPVLKWVGVGLMVVGGLGVLNSVAWCGLNTVCTTPLVVYGGAAGVGWYLFANNR